MWFEHGVTRGRSGCLAAARALGARCILMLTGVTTKAQAEALPKDQAPTAIAANAAELEAALAALDAPA